MFVDEKIIFNKDITGKKNKKTWKNLFEDIQKNLYLFNICNLKLTNKHYFIIVFEFLSVEVLNLLFSLSQLYSFIKLKRTENYKVNTDLESHLQLNFNSSKKKLSSSSIGLLLGINTRYENSSLNLKLRQRYFKGNFKLLTIGSLFNFTFSVTSLGSNVSILQNILEGNHTICKNLKKSKNPILIYNTEIFKRNDSKILFKIIEILKLTNIIRKTWNGLNISNSYLNETGTNYLYPFSYLTLKDLFCFSSIYLINGTLDNNVINIKKLVESNLLNFINLNSKTINKSIFIEQHPFKNKIVQFNNKPKLLNFKKYLYLPSNTFFEVNETYLNTEGLIKRTNKLISTKKTKSHWKLIREILSYVKKISYLHNQKEKNILSFNMMNQYNFKNYINFHYSATQSLTDFNFYLNIKNEPFNIYKKSLTFKKNLTKIFKTKLKYWLDDFFNGGKDGYSQNSLVLTNCSVNLRKQNTTFF